MFSDNEEDGEGYIMITHNLLCYRAAKCDAIRPMAKPINHASGSKKLQYTAVNYELLALSETIEP